jgi:mannose-1-phosphate guanylyltransferase
VVQPTNRGTGLGLLLALLVIAKSDPAASVACLPSDHYVENEDVLARSLWKAMALQTVACDKLTLLGMIPNAPDPGFGYLTSRADPGVGMRPTAIFVEKPSQEMAAQLIAHGSLWNSGIFAGRLQAMLNLYPRHVPGLVHHLKLVVEAWSDLRRPSKCLEELYSRHAAIDFSRDVLQKQPARLQFIAVPQCGWNDVGTPERLATTLWALRSKRERPATVQTRAPAFHLEAAWVPAMAANGVRFSPESLAE